MQSCLSETESEQVSCSKSNIHLDFIVIVKAKQNMIATFDFSFFVQEKGQIGSSYLSALYKSHKGIVPQLTLRESFVFVNRNHGDKPFIAKLLT